MTKRAMQARVIEVANPDKSTKKKYRCPIPCVFSKEGDAACAI